MAVIKRLQKISYYMLELFQMANSGLYWWGKFITGYGIRAKFSGVSWAHPATHSHGSAQWRRQDLLRGGAKLEIRS